MNFYDTRLSFERFIASYLRRAPVGRFVRITVHTSTDPKLVCAQMRGVVRSYEAAKGGTPRALLIELDRFILFAPDDAPPSHV